MLKRSIFVASIFMLSATSQAQIQNDTSVIFAEKVQKNCLANGWDADQFKQLKSDGFVVENSEERNKLALQMLNCLAHKKGEIRDGVAFSALSSWLRGNKLSNDTVMSIYEQLTAVVSKEVVDPDGIYQPFAVLVYAEALRVDRKSPYLTQEQREQAVETVANYLMSIQDFRGFEKGVGWRHGIAHSADATLQLALNKQITKAQLDRLLEALNWAIQVSQHFYIYGEPNRLALPVIYIFLRKMHSIKEWQEWLMLATTPKPLTSWDDAYNSQQGLAKLHNVRGFLLSLYATMKPSGNEYIQQMMPALNEALKQGDF